MWITITAMLLAGHAPLAEAYAPPVQDAAVAPATDELQERYDALMKDYVPARDAFREAIAAARKKHMDAGLSRSDFKSPPAIEGSFYPKFQAIADDGHAAAGVWCLSQHSFSGLKGDAAKTDKLERYGSILDAKPSDATVYNLLRTMKGDTRGPDPLLNKSAAFAILDKIKAQAQGTALAARALEEKASLARPDGATAEQVAEAVVFYKEIMAKYPDSVSARRCKGPLFSAENLQIGMIAPDIVGQDHDGNDIKLTDFKGKVTVIDFWAFW